MQNRLVITTASRNTEDLLLDFLISIRNEGKYDGDILILDYGILSDFSDWVIKKFNIIIKKFNTDGIINNKRYADSIEILKEYSDSIVIFSDSDIWFEAPIEHFFEEYNGSKEILFDLRFGSEHKKYKALERFKFLDKLYYNQIKENIDKLEGHISCDFMIGRGRYLSNLFGGFSKFPDKYFSDEAYFNYAFDERCMGILKTPPLDRNIVKKELSDYLIKIENNKSKFDIDLHKELNIKTIHDFSIDKKMTYKTNHFTTFWREIIS